MITKGYAILAFPIFSGVSAYVSAKKGSKMSTRKINTKQFASEKIKIRGRSSELEIFSLENAYNLKI